MHLLLQVNIKVSAASFRYGSGLKPVSYIQIALAKSNSLSDPVMYLFLMVFSICGVYEFNG